MEVELQENEGENCWEDEDGVWDETAHLRHRARDEHHLERLKIAMLERMERTSMLDHLEPFCQGEEPYFWEIVLCGLQNPEQCDQIREQTQIVLSEAQKGKRSKQDASEALTRLHDDATANMESLAGLERHFLLMTAANLFCLGMVDNEQDVHPRLTDIFQQLNENRLESDSPQTSQEHRALQSTEESYEFTKSVLRAIDGDQSPTFWEMAAAGIEVPSEEPDLLADALFAWMQAIEAGGMSWLDSAIIEDAPEFGAIVAGDLQRAVAKTRELALEIQLRARDAGIEMGNHVRSEPWRRLNPHVRFDEGLRL